MAKRTLSFEIKERFIKAIDEVFKENYPGKTEGDILRPLGITQPAFSRLRKSETNYPTLDNCSMLCSIYKISEAWLISGKGPMKVLNEKKVSAVELLKEALRIMEK